MVLSSASTSYFAFSPETISNVFVVGINRGCLNRDKTVLNQKDLDGDQPVGFSFCSRGFDQAHSQQRKKKKVFHRSAADVLCVATTKNTVVIFNTSDWRKIRSIKLDGHCSNTSKLTCMSHNFATSASHCIVGSSDGNLYDVDIDAEIIKKIFKNEEPISSCCVSNCGKYSVCSGQRLHVIDVTTEKCICSYTGHAAAITTTLWIKTETDQYILTASRDDRVVNIWPFKADGGSENKIVKRPTCCLSVNDCVSHVSVLVQSQSVRIAVSTVSGHICLFEQFLNGSHVKKPALPTHTVRFATDAKKPVALPVHTTTWRSTQESGPVLVVLYGSPGCYMAEELVVTSIDAESVLIRKDPKQTAVQAELDSVSSFRTPTIGKDATYLAPDCVVSVPSKKLSIVDDAMFNKNDSSNLSMRGRLRSSGMATASSADELDVTTASPMLVQALQSSDTNVIRSIIDQQSNNSDLVSRVVRTLPVSSIVPLLKHLAENMRTGYSIPNQLLWLQSVFSSHMSLLTSQPTSMELLSEVYQLMNTRVGMLDRMCRLRGRIDTLLDQSEAKPSSDMDLAKATPAAMRLDENELDNDADMFEQASMGVLDGEADWDAEEGSDEDVESGEESSDESAAEDSDGVEELVEEFGLGRRRPLVNGEAEAMEEDESD